MKKKKIQSWKAFWDKGGWWRAILLTVLYMAIYLGAGLVIGTVAGDQVVAEDIFRTPQSVFVGLTLSLIVGSAALAAFVYSVGWFKPLFAQQPVKGSWWMWAAPLFLVAAIVLRFLGINYPNLDDAERGYAEGLIDAQEWADVYFANVRGPGTTPRTVLGGHIGIHGYGNRPYLPIDWTQGCIAVSNEEADFLYHRLPIGTPVLIHE